MPAPIDLLHKQFCRLSVTGLAPKTNGRGRYWICQCECGNEVKVASDKLISGHTRSCGCLQRESVTIKNSTHGLTTLPEYQIWKAIKARCSKTSGTICKNYKARGIIVCKEWENDFPRFLGDMGMRPIGNFTIERIDNNKGYTKENCKWADRAAQSRNRRSNRFITHNGITLCLTDWARKLNVTVSCLVKRLDKLGWTLEEALKSENS